MNAAERTGNPFPAGGWNPSGGGALFAERELGLELLDHARQCRARPPPVIGLQFRERFFERTALLHDLVEVIDHGRACSRFPVRRGRCRRRPVVAGARASAGWRAPTLLGTIAARTVVFENGFRRCDSPPHRRFATIRNRGPLSAAACADRRRSRRGRERGAPCDEYKADRW